jgi:hypothetical protein
MQCSIGPPVGLHASPTATGRGGRIGTGYRRSRAAYRRPVCSLSFAATRSSTILPIHARNRRMKGLAPREHCHPSVNRRFVRQDGTNTTSMECPITACSRPRLKTNRTGPQFVQRSQSSIPVQKITYRHQADGLLCSLSPAFGTLSRRGDHTHDQSALDWIGL